MSKDYRAIAIDGPSGAGKSSVARSLAAELGYLYVDTGAIYRTVGLHVRRSGADPKEEGSVAPLLNGLRIEVAIGPDGRQHMYLSGKDVTDVIRDSESSRYASEVSAHPSVRAFLLSMQQEIARQNNVIMDGRDIGTVVLPDADVKIFLTGSAEERARRRHLELSAHGQDISYERVLYDIIQRDKKDTGRAAAPLRQADDALLVDTTKQSLDEVVAHLKTMIKERLCL